MIKTGKKETEQQSGVTSEWHWSYALKILTRNSTKFDAENMKHY